MHNLVYLNMFKLVIQYLEQLSNLFLLLQRFQHMDTGRITRLRELVRSYADVERNIMPIIGKCLDSITAAADSIDPVKVSVNKVSVRDHWKCRTVND